MDTENQTSRKSSFGLQTSRPQAPASRYDDRNLDSICMEYVSRAAGCPGDVTLCSQLLSASRRGSPAHLPHRCLPPSLGVAALRTILPTAALKPQTGRKPSFRLQTSRPQASAAQSRRVSAWNIYIGDILGRGSSGTASLDTQAKHLSQ